MNDDPDSAKHTRRSRTQSSRSIHCNYRTPVPAKRNCSVSSSDSFVFHRAEGRQVLSCVAGAAIQGGAMRGGVEVYQRIEKILESGPFVPGTSNLVHRAHFLYVLKWHQIAARIHSMNSGWSIASVKLPKHLWRDGIETAYRLDSKPLEEESREDWFVHQTGKPRPSCNPWRAAYSPRRIATDDCFQLTASSFGTSTAP